MVKAIRFERFGGPEVLQYCEIDVGAPGPGEARIAHRAIGLNFIDVYHRTGLYPLTLPSGLGGEAAGVVVAVGAGVTHVQPGDRVAYTAPAPPGSYADERVLDARWLVRLPAAISDQAGAAMMLKGLTAWYLLHRSYRVAAGDWILLYAAAGGVGSIAAQWARELGARVIGVVGSAAKRELALAHGCEHVLIDGDDIPGRVRELSGGGVPVVYDSVGRDTFMRSLDCLRPMGMAINFGTASGQVEPFPLQRLLGKSLIVTRPTLVTYIADRGDYERAAAAFFDVVRSGAVRVEVGTRYALRDAARAHVELESRRAIRLPVLVP